MSNLGIIEQKFFEAISQGMSREDSAVLAGLPIELLYIWESRAQAGVNPFYEFFATVRVLESKHKHSVLKNVLKVAEGDEAAGLKPNWNAAAWVLERRWGDEFGKVDEEEVVAQITKRFADLKDGVSRIILRNIEPEQRERVSRELEELFE